MSNFCEVCKRSYPDDLAACPHCEGAVELNAVEVVEEAPQAGPEDAVLVEPDSAIDLGIPALPSGSQAGEGSGLSVIEWASLVEEESSSAGSAPARFDDPADANLLPETPPGREATGDEPPLSEPTLASLPANHDDEDALASDLDAVRSIFAGDASASFARRGPSQPPADPPSDKDDSSLDLLAPGGEGPALEAEAPPPARAIKPPESSGIDLGASPVLDEPAPLSAHEMVVDAPDSWTDLTAADLEQEVVAEAAGQPSAAEAADSGIDLAALVEEEPAAEGRSAVRADSGIDLTEADIVVEGPAPAWPDAGAASSGSGIDLTEFVVEDEAPAEAVAASAAGSEESGIDLTAMMLEEPASAEPAVVGRADSGIDLDEVEVVEIPASTAPPRGAVAADSGIEVTEFPMPEEAELEELPAVEVVDSGVALGESVFVDEPLFDESVIGAPVSGESGIDPAEAVIVDSGLDLTEATVDAGPISGAADEIIVDESGTALDAGRPASGDEAVDLAEATDAEIESSAVDLGASASFPIAPSAPPSAPSDIETTRPYEAKSRSIHGEEEITPSEVNLGGRRDELTVDDAEDFFEESAAPGGSGPAIHMVDEDTDGLDVVEEPAEEAGLGEPETVAEEEDEAPAPARSARPKQEKRRSGAGAWLVGASLGGLVATGVCLGLWLFNIEPPKDWRAMTAGLTGAKPTPPGISGDGTNPGNGPAAPATLADKVSMVKGGDLDKAKQADIEKADETKPDELAARGEYRVRNYLQQQSVNKAPIKPDDPALQAGLKDLETASKDNPDALFYLAVTLETTNDLAGAQKTYAEGLERYKNDPAQRERFEAGLNRVTAKEAARPAGMGRATPRDRAALLALLLTGVEPPAAEPPAKDAPPAPAGGGVTPTEAGSAFWKAVRLAHDQQYADAIKELDLAAEVHVKRRFSVLGKAQNPNSDPTEEIFLRSCEELKAYWQLQEKLRTAGYLDAAKGKDAPKAVDDLLVQNKDLTEKVTKAETDADDLKKDLTTAKKDLDDSKKEADAAKKDLDATKKDLDAAKDDLESKKKDLIASEKKAADLADKLKAAAETVAKREETIKGVADALRPRFVRPEADDAAVLAGAKEAMRIASIGDPRDQIRVLERDVRGLKGTLQQRWAPEQMLTFWLPLLRERGRRDLADDAITDADRVLDDDAAPPAVKARALAVRGIALRDEEKYDDAKADLEKAKKNLSAEDGEWLLETEAALTEANDPAASFAARAEAFRREGRPAQALVLLNRALETAGPASRGRLLVERGTWRLDDALARGKGRAAADDPDLAAARKDAEDAAKDGSPEALYLSGRVAEELGQVDAAIDNYRQALAAHGALDAAGARYRAALARVLVLPRPVKPAEGGGKVGANGARPSLEMLVALLTVGLQPADLPGQVDPATKEALKLADEILSAKEGDVSFEARAQALAVKGLWTQALTAYAEGLRPFLSPEHAAGLMRIVQGHPALHQPSLLILADPLEAEKHYAAGLRWYYDRQYPKAEKEFFTAVEHDGQDARYYYFLGLARLMQGDVDAAEDFEQGARLERQNRPGRAAVSAALERVQGPARLRLNDVRDRPR